MADFDLAIIGSGESIAGYGEREPYPTWPQSGAVRAAVAKGSTMRNES
jgi:hypothetical protein